MAAPPVREPAGCGWMAGGCGEAAVRCVLLDVTLNAGLLVVKARVCAPAPVSVRFVNVATPFTAVTLVVPPSVPLPLATAAVTDSVAPAPVVTTNPALSRIRTTGCVVNAEPLVAPAGCVCIDSDAATCVAVRLADVALVTPLAEKVSVCAPLPLSCSVVNVATPFTAFTVVVPSSVPVPPAIAAGTDPVLPVPPSAPLFWPRSAACPLARYRCATRCRSAAALCNWLRPWLPMPPKCLPVRLM